MTNPRLVLDNLPLVKYVANKYKNVTSLPFDDLVQEGTLGLMRAAESYRADRGTFASWAQTWIRGFITAYIKSDRALRRRSRLDVADPVEVFDVIAALQELHILRAHLGVFTNTLNRRDRAILEERLLAEVPRSLQSIADQYGITRERVRQIEARLVDQIRGMYRDKKDSTDMIDFMTKKATIKLKNSR